MPSFTRIKLQLLTTNYFLSPRKTPTRIILLRIANRSELPFRVHLLFYQTNIDFPRIPHKNMPRLSSIFVIPEVAGRSSDTTSCTRHSKVTPWHRLPGRLYLSDAQNIHVKRAARNLLRILEEQHEELQKENFVQLKKSIRDPDILLHRYPG